jgi:hypothetical protein
MNKFIMTGEYNLNNPAVTLRSTSGQKPAHALTAHRTDSKELFFGKNPSGKIELNASSKQDLLGQLLALANGIQNNEVTLSNNPNDNLSVNLVDNNADALDIQEGTNNYININTTDGSENISFGNSGVNPTYTFVGSGLTTTEGSLAVNGGTISTTQATGNLFNTGATTLNIGGAATTLTLGASTGTTTINNQTVALPNGKLGVGISSPVSALQVTRPLTLGATGKALAIFNQIENQDILTASASGVTQFTIARNGNITSTGDLALNGGDLTSTSPTGTLFNANVTDLSIGGDATTLDTNNASRPQDAASESIRRVLENNQYDLEKAVLSVELVSLAKEQSVVVAPIAGVITSSTVDVTGVSSTATDSITIVDPDGLQFLVDIDEADIGLIQEGQSVEITLDAFPNKTIAGTVNEIDFASHATSTGGTAYSTIVLLPSQTDTYRIGMNGDAEIVVEKKKQILTAPSSSLFEDEYVYVKKDKIFEKRKVTVGIQNDFDIEILSGLSIGEEVALDPEKVTLRQKGTKIQKM